MDTYTYLLPSNAWLAQEAAPPTQSRLALFPMQSLLETETLQLKTLTLRLSPLSVEPTPILLTPAHWMLLLLLTPPSPLLLAEWLAAHHSSDQTSALHVERDIST